MSKKFKITPDKLVRLVPHKGGCLATDRITVDGCNIGYMYREQTHRAADTGWRFFEGNESEEYMSQSNNSDVYAVNTIANYDPSILEYLDTPAPCSFEKTQGENSFKRIDE